jgi:glucose-1-phosphate cytidylyltransferase
MTQNSVNSQVVILCGGMGTRLREETEFRPKPLVEIGGKPILWHIMKIYSHFGFNDFVLCLGYKGHMIKEYFLNYRMMNSDFTLRLNSPDHPEFHSVNAHEPWSITFADTGAETMTGARVKRIEPFITGDDFMLTYGDGVADIDIGRLLEFHRGHGKIATVTGVRTQSRYGELSVQDGQVKRFSEKPQSEEGLISGGFFAFRRQIFDYLPDDDGCALERGPLESLAQQGQLMSYTHTGYWHCMDTYRDFIALNELWRQDAPWKVWK